MKKNKGPIIWSLLFAAFVTTSCNRSEADPRANINAIALPSKKISISINKPENEVYQYTSNPQNFPKWLASVDSVTQQSDTVWTAETNFGNIEIELSPANNLGIVDHIVKLPNGAVVNNPLRILKSGTGSEVVFTLFHLPNKTEQEFDQDAKLVEADLKTLKQILETQQSETLAGE
ncbi:hypothetical protein [Flavobacterium sp.]|uniref:hypothetical protein n=1 Tax=Flavobacterium sp. TaxID=239 RepID=UPI0039E6DD35